MSLTLTPMLAGQFLRPPKPAANAVHRARWSAASTSLETQLRPGARRRAAPHAAHASRCSSARWRSAVFLYATVPTGFFPQQDTGFIQGVVLTSQDASFAKMSGKIEQVGRRHRARTRTSRGRLLPRQRRRQPGQPQHQPQAEGRRAHAPRADQIINDLRPQLAPAGRRARPCCRRRRTSTSAAAPARRSTSTRCPTPTWTSSTPGRRSWSPRMQAAAAPGGRQLRPAVPGRGGQADHRPRRGGAASASRRPTSTPRSTTSSASTRWRSTSRS